MKTLKKSLQLCARVAKSAQDDRLKFIRLKTTNGALEILATDKFRIVKEILKLDNPIILNGFIKPESVKEVKGIDDIKKHLISAPEFPDMPAFKFTNYIEIESEPLKRFCKIHADNNTILKITMGALVISFREVEVKTKIKIDIIKSNIKYFKTALNSKLLKDILGADKILKIKMGKSGREPLSFDNQIIMPTKIRG